MSEESMEWTTVSDAETQEETKIVFEDIGDEFIADQFLGYRELTDSASGQHYVQARFRKDNEIFFVRANHSLKSGLDNVRVGQGPIRIVYARDIDTGRESPMRGYTVQLGRSKAIRAAKPTARARAAGKTE